MSPEAGARHPASLATSARHISAAVAVLAARQLPAGQRVVALERGIVATCGGIPDHPVARAAATLTLALSAAATALERGGSAAHASPQALIDALMASISAAEGAHRALLVPGDRKALIALADRTGYAASLAADALVDSAVLDSLATSSQLNQTRIRLPLSWRALIESLGHSVAALGDMGDREVVDALVSSFTGAQHVVRAYESSPADEVHRRFARLAALSAAYAGWGLVAGNGREGCP